MNNQFQRWIFEEVEKNYAKKSEAIEDIGELLSIGKDAVYRRFRGDTFLAPEELEILARRYRLSLDHYIYKKSDTVFFTYNAFSRSIKSFEDYLNGIEEVLTQVASLSGLHIRYTVPELPVFYIFFIPELIAFKLYTWGRTAWDFEYLQDKKFDFDLIPYPLFEKIEAIQNMYINVPSTELWSLNLIDFTLNQIEYYVSSDTFADDKIALTLCDKLLELLQHLEQMTKAGQKFRVGAKPKEDFSNLNVYHNEMLYTDHTIIFSSELGNAIFGTFGNPDFIKSSDARMNTHITEWFEKLLGKSQPISTHAEKTRMWFFSRLTRKVNALRSRIESQLDFD